METKKQTAVEWLVEQRKWSEITNEHIEKAKAMEKEQIIEAYEQGEAEWTPFEFKTAQGYFIETYGQ